MTDEYARLQDISRRRTRETSLSLRRSLLDIIDWRDRLICISGARGVGKTTLMLQHIKEAFKDSVDSAIYVSLDNLLFGMNRLEDIVNEHYRNGGTHIFIDEIHFLDNWQNVIKNIYDDYPNLNIVYTGSSLLKIDSAKGDLSRRQIRYELPGLSFREYLFFEDEIFVEKIGFDELIDNHISIANKVSEDVKVLKLFSKYLQEGYYPFYREVYAGYDERIRQVVNQVLESDYPAVENINYSTVQKIKKMLYILAQSCPQTPNMSELYTELETDRNQGLKMLYILEKAHIINLLSSEKNKLKNMAKPDKIYCDNTNIMYAFTRNVDVGTLRETFFLNQLKSSGHNVSYPSKGDFLVDDLFLFEVGGRKKSFNQIADIDNSFLAIDDEEVGRGNKIPLWMFGLLY